MDRLRYKAMVEAKQVIYRGILSVEKEHGKVPEDPKEVQANIDAVSALMNDADRIALLFPSPVGPVSEQTSIRSRIVLARAFLELAHQALHLMGIYVLCWDRGGVCVNQRISVFQNFTEKINEVSGVYFDVFVQLLCALPAAGFGRVASQIAMALVEACYAVYTRREWRTRIEAELEIFAQAMLWAKMDVLPEPPVMLEVRTDPKQPGVNYTDEQMDRLMRTEVCYAGKIRKLRCPLHLLPRIPRNVDGGLRYVCVAHLAQGGGAECNHLPQ